MNSHTGLLGNESFFTYQSRFSRRLGLLGFAEHSFVSFPSSLLDDSQGLLIILFNG